MKLCLFPLSLLTPCQSCNCFIIMIDFYFCWARIGLKVMALGILNTIVSQIVFFQWNKISIWNTKHLITFKDNSYRQLHWVTFLLRIFTFEAVIESPCILIYTKFFVIFFAELLIEFLYISGEIKELFTHIYTQWFQTYYEY